MTDNTLRARVATVLDEELIAVNAGSKAGVKVGDRLFILRETNIPDPDNPDDSLGTAFVRRGTMVVEDVQENFSVARVARASKTMLSPAEATFVISTTRVGDGSRQRVFVEPGGPVDIELTEDQKSRAFVL